MATESDETSPLLEKNASIEAPVSPTISCLRKVINIVSNISVEPLLFFHLISHTIESVFHTNLLIDKTCTLELNYSKEVCDNLDDGTHEAEQDAVQKLTNTYLMYGSWIEYGLGFFVMMFLGAWGDAKGRVLPLFIPSLGSTLKCVIVLLNIYFWQWKPIYLILSYIPYGLGGSNMGLIMAIYAFLGHHSKDRARTTRLSFVYVMMGISTPIGSTLGTIIFAEGGYISIYWTVFGFSLLSNLCIIICIRSQPQETDNSKKLTLNTVKQSLMAAIKPRPGRLRSYIMAYIVIVQLGSISKESSHFLYIYTRKVFAWTYVQYNIYSVVKTVLSSVASSVYIPVLSYHFQIEDSLLGFIGSALSIFSGIITGTAPYDWLLYVALITSCLGHTVSVASRSALSKMVAKNELGGIFSIIAMGEAIIPILMQPAYTYIYNYTLDVLPGAIFIIGSFTSIIVCCIFTWLLTTPAKKELELSV